MHILERTVELQVSVDELWSFVSTPVNLNAITPPHLHFRILCRLPDTMYDGLMVRYQVRIPLFGTRQWISEMKHIRPPVSFVDEQRQGPYKFWYHYHEIQARGDKCTRMIDRVYYRMPFEPLGSLVHLLAVKRMLADIFAYRNRALHRLFG